MGKRWAGPGRSNPTPRTSSTSALRLRFSEPTLSRHDLPGGSCDGSDDRSETGEHEAETVPVGASGSCQKSAAPITAPSPAVSKE